MAVYAFLCAFRSFRSFVLLLTSWVGYFAYDPPYPTHDPHISTHPSLHTCPPSSSTTTTTPPAQEGTIAWQTNIQGIQNLMGALSDLDDFIRPHIPCITHSHSGSTPYTHIIFMLALTSFVGLLLILPLIPIRAVALFVGLTPLVLTHPVIRAHVVPPAQALTRSKILRTWLGRKIDNDRLEDKHWNTEMKDVELWENERWNSSLDSEGTTGDGGWGKIYLNQLGSNR